MADLLLPEDIQRGYIYEPHPTASVLDWLLQAVQQWEAEGGEAQVGCYTLTPAVMAAVCLAHRSCKLWL